MRPIADLDELLRSLEPALNAGTFVFGTLPPDQTIDLAEVIALVQEPEGVSVVVAEKVAGRIGLQAAMRCAWITLTVHSDLQAVGLSAAFSSVLARAGISCNVVAGTHHDHIFVPAHQAQAAMAELRSLQNAQPQTPAR